MVRLSDLSEPERDVRNDALALACHLYGWCPVQGEGTIGDYPLYFRARGDSWSFTVVLVANANPDDLASWMRPAADGFFDYAGRPGYELTGRYGSEFDAGYMPYDVAEKLIVACAKRFTKALAARNANVR
jgi:hypothetical protein